MTWHEMPCCAVAADGSDYCEKGQRSPPDGQCQADERRGRDEKSQQQIIYHGQVVNLQFTPLKLLPSEKASEDYFVLDQGTIYSYVGKILIAVVLFLVIVFLFLKRKKIIHYINNTTIFILTLIYNFIKYIDLKLSLDLRSRFASQVFL